MQNYSDPSDRATALEEHERETALQAMRNQVGLKPVGRCYNCDEVLPAGQLFCARPEGELHCCRSDYELRMRNRG